MLDAFPYLPKRLTGVAVGSTAALLLVMACAREEPPPGARPDRVPPAVRELNPARNAVVPGFGGSAEVRFDEPISGARTLQQNLIASPANRYEVSSGFSNIKIKPPDGWVDGVVYYFQIPEGIADLLGNRTEEPIELVFSTGPELSPTRVTGEVRGRVDGNAVSPGRVVFYNLAGDSIPYGTQTDRQGEFELPYLPPDDYWSFGFQDLNSNLLLERLFEPYDSVRLDLEAGGTAALTFRIVEPDTTPPLLGLIRGVDDLVLELEFDDYLDPEQDLSTSGLVLRQVESGARWEVEQLRLELREQARGRGRAGGREQPAGRAPAPERRDTVPPEPEPPDTATVEPGPPDTATVELEPPDTAAVGAEEPLPDSDAVEADSLPAGGAPADSLAPDAEVGRPAPQVEERAPSLQEGPPAQEADTLPAAEKLPSRLLRVQLVTPLVPGTYLLTIDRVVNLRRLEASVDTTFTYPLTQEQAAEGRGEGASP